MMIAARQMQYSKTVMDMIQCIENQYSKQDLSLQYLAADYHLNAAYLGRITTFILFLRK